MYYPEREAYLRDMADVCCEAQGTVYDEVMQGINKTLDELKPLLKQDDFNIVFEMFKKRFY